MLWTCIPPRPSKGEHTQPRTPPPGMFVTTVPNCELPLDGIIFFPLFLVYIKHNETIWGPIYGASQGLWLIHQKSSIALRFHLFSLLYRNFLLPNTLSPRLRSDLLPHQLGHNFPDPPIGSTGNVRSFRNLIRLLTSKRCSRFHYVPESLVEWHWHHPQSPCPSGVGRFREYLGWGQRNSDELALGVIFQIFVVADVAGLQGKYGMITTHASVFARVPNGSALAVDYHADVHLLAWILVSGIANRGLQWRVVPVVFLAPNRFPGPSLAPLEAFEALWVA